MSSANRNKQYKIISVEVTRTVAESLDRAAKQNSVSRSDYLRSIITASLNKMQG